MQHEIFKPRSEPQDDAWLIRHGFRKRRLQVAPMHDPVGRAVTEPHLGAERQIYDLAPGFRGPDRQTFGYDLTACESGLNSERDENAGRIWGKLDAGADIGKPCRLLGDQHAIAGAGERQGASQPADAGACDQDGSG